MGSRVVMTTIGTSGDDWLYLDFEVVTGIMIIGGVGTSAVYALWDGLRIVVVWAMAGFVLAGTFHATKLVVAAGRRMKVTLAVVTLRNTRCF